MWAAKYRVWPSIPRARRSTGHVGRLGTIGRADLDGQNGESLVNSATYLDGLRLDVAGGKMYWTEQGNGVFSANLDGSGVAIFKADITVNKSNAVVAYGPLPTATAHRDPHADPHDADRHQHVVRRRRPIRRP